MALAKPEKVFIKSGFNKSQTEVSKYILGWYEQILLT